MERIRSFTLETEFPQFNASERLRYIYYNQATRDEYRLTPLPTIVTAGADEDDIFEFLIDEDNKCVARVLRRDGADWLSADQTLGSRKGAVFSVSMPVFAPRETRESTTYPYPSAF